MNEEFSFLGLRDAQVVAIVMFTMTFIGTLGNIVVAVFTRKLPSMRNPFGHLLGNQAIGEAVLCGCFAFYTAPMLFFDVDWMKKYSYEAGWINLICYDIAIWSHLFIAINRLVAICFPFKYNFIFSHRNTMILIIFTWIVALTTPTILQKAFPWSCFYFTEKIWAYVYTESEVCKIITVFFNFYKDITFVCTITILDVIAVVNVRLVAKSLHATSEAQKQRRKRDINFLIQAVIQGIVFAIELHTYFIFAWKFENKWIFWLMTTFAWNCVHTLDGIIIITFNKEFHTISWSLLRKTQTLFFRSCSFFQPDYYSKSKFPGSHSSDIS